MAETEAGEEFFHETAALPVRFVWRIDGSGKFSEVSPEFARAVGHHSADIIGRTFRDVAQVYALDMGGEISDLLERRDTWSGRSVLWPIEGTDLRAPVDLAALPIYGRDREFDGFKGFGIVRLADAVVDADGIGLSLVGPLTKIDARETVEPKGEPDVDDPWKGEKPVLSFVSPVERPRIDDAKIIRLEERRGPRGDAAIEAPLATNVLSASERSAFREIAERLRDDDARKVTFGKRMIRPGDKRDAPETIIVDPDVVDTDSDEIESEPMDEFSAAAYLPEDDAEIAAPGDQPLAEPTEQSKYEAMLRDLIKTVEKPIDEDLLPTLVTDATPAIQYDEMLRDILVTVDEPAIDQKLIRVMPTEEILRLAEEHHRQELEERERNGVAEIDAETDVLQSDEHLDLDPVAERDEEIAPDDDVVSPVHWPDVAFDEEEELAELPLPQAEPAPSQSGPDTSILTRLPAPIMIYSGRQVHFANPAFLELTGYRSASELETLGGIDQLIAGDHADEESDRISIRIGGNGIRPFNTIIRSVPWDGKQAMMLTIREQDLHPNHNVRALPISDDERRDLLELRQEAAELSSILDTATDGVVILDAKGNIRSLSNSAEALFGFDPTEIVGKPFSLLLATESQRSVSDYISGMSGTGVASIMNDGREVIGREAHGRFIPLFMTIGRLQDSDGYCAVLRDMTQWKRAEEELIEARRAAEEASATKTEFLTRVSHEIRTPLNAIIGFSELMAEERFGPIGNQRYLDYSKDINRSGRHVLDLVNDLLDISKIEAGEQEMNFEAVALNETLAETVALMQPQANRERVIIRSSFASTLPEIVADLRSIKQIALNLLSNAIRYTGAGGQVIISTAHELTGDVVIRVRDTGVGMSAQDIDQAMKPFKQLNTIKRGRGDGTGLGLPLTKAMVEGNRAKFSLTSTPGKGTLVEITFPSVRVLAN